VLSGGTAIGTTVDYGGQEIVYGGGTASGTIVNGGGFEVLSAGAAATDTELTSDGAIDITYLPFSFSAASATIDSNDVLTVSAGGQTYTQQLVGDYTGSAFVVAPDLVGGTTVTLNGAACYRAGTLILTDRGEVAIENLAVGDKAITVTGKAVPITWIGHRHVDCRLHPRPEQVWPVRIAAYAFGPDTPHRDVWLSPDHAVFVADVLVPIKYLIDGYSIAQQQTDDVLYYHIELPRHDVLLANGLPAESYLDTGDRAAFANGDDTIRLFPDFSTITRDAMAVWEARGYAPLVVHGPQIEAARARIRSLLRQPKRITRGPVR
jgi:autotransporter passenger strand-loop-strand repeat protein